MKDKIKKLIEATSESIDEKYVEIAVLRAEIAILHGQQENLTNLLTLK